MLILLDNYFYCPSFLCRNEMGWRYRSLVQVLDRKRSEVEQLSHDFESKLRAKEVSCYIPTLAVITTSIKTFENFDCIIHVDIA